MPENEPRFCNILASQILPVLLFAVRALVICVIICPMCSDWFWIKWPICATIVAIASAVSAIAIGEGSSEGS